MDLKWKKFLSFLLLFFFVALIGNLMAKERKGADLLVTKKDGQQVSGELITVKPSSLLLKNTDGRDETVDVADISVIKILKGSQAFQYGIAGFLIGGATRGILHSMVRKEKEGEEATQHFVQESVKWAAIVGAAGVVVGTAAGIDKTVKIEGKSDVQVDSALRKLSKKARVPNYQ